ncbi:hypothetical protein OAG24_00395 [bacterium]|nr:hypothetical protein [bacterium]
MFPELTPYIQMQIISSEIIKHYPYHVITSILLPIFIYLYFSRSNVRTRIILSIQGYIDIVPVLVVWSMICICFYAELTLAFGGTNGTKCDQPAVLFSVIILTYQLIIFLTIFADIFWELEELSEKTIKFFVSSWIMSVLFFVLLVAQNC